jgi:predicted Zn finger-like uncharacterized protein
MDVRCTQCGTEYEFDAERVKPTGVTVKCTTCGHVFKVQRDGLATDPPAPAVAPGTEGWMVRHKDGTVMRFKELTTLQKWIVEQKVSATDEISKSGKSWKKLGEIAELASFFQVVAAARAAQHSAAAAAPASVPPGPGVSPTTPEAPTTAMPTPATTNTPMPPQPEPGAPGDVGPTDLGEGGPMPPTMSQEFFAGSVGAALEELDDEDPVVQWRRRAKARNAVIGGLVVIVLCIAGLFFGARSTFDAIFGPVLASVGLEAGAEPEGPDPLVDRIELAFAKDDADEGRALIEEVDSLLKGGEATAPQLAALARLHAAAAYREEDLAALLGAAGDARATDAGEAGKRARAHLAEAYKLAGKAQSKDAKSRAVELAFAAYQAAKGAVAETGAHLEAATAEASPEAVTREAAVLAALAKARHAVKAGDAAAAAATRSSLPAGDDARVVFAGLRLAALAAPDDAARAAEREAVAAFVAAHATHARAKTLLESLPTTAAPADDAGAAAEPGEEPAPLEEDKPSGPSPEASPPAGGDKPPAEAGAKSYKQLMAAAKRHRMRDRASKALPLYQQAADKKPGAAAPWVGMGWCYVDLDQSAKAIGPFKQALTNAPSLPEAHFGLAEANRFAGNKAAALRGYKRYLELAPSGPDASVARNAIESLE